MPANEEKVVTSEFVTSLLLVSVIVSAPFPMFILLLYLELCPISFRHLVLFTLLGVDSFYAGFQINAG